MIEDTKDAFENQFPEFASAESRLSLGPAKQVFGQVDGRFHGAIFTALLLSVNS
jgi:hypothetical protein